MRLLRALWSALRLVLVSTLVLGLGYNLAVTGIASLVFPKQAQGSLVTFDGRVVGSRLIGQQWTSARFFQGRPSATSPEPYNASASSPSNFGPTSPNLITEIKSNLKDFLARNPGVQAGSVPPSMVESSGSGLDPDISPAAAYIQAPRVAAANHVSVGVVDGLIAREIRGRFLGIYGDPYLNVLMLNIAVLELGNHSSG